MQRGARRLVIQAARFRYTEPGHQGRDDARDAVHEEWHVKAELFGQVTAGKGPDADRKQEYALVDRHGSTSGRPTRDIGQNDHPCSEDNPGAGTGRETCRHQLGVTRCHRAPEIAERGYSPADGECVSPPQSIGDPARRQAEEYARESVHRDGGTDCGLRDVKGLGVQRQDRNHRPEPELVDGDQHAHPCQYAAFVQVLSVRLVWQGGGCEVAKLRPVAAG